MASTHPSQAESATVIGPTPDRDDILEERVDYYRAWLINESLEFDAHYTRNAQSEYASRALAPRALRGKPVNAFAPIQIGLSAIQTLTSGQAALLALAVLAFSAGLAVDGVTTLTVALGAVTAIYLLNLAIMMAGVFNVVGRSPEERIDARVLTRLGERYWPPYTILCPLYQEAAIVPQFVAAMNALDYPQDRLQVLLLTEERDQTTRAAIRALALPAHFHVVTVPEGEPRTKPRACNFGLLHATGRYTVIYDAEDIPDPRQLKKAVLAFANHDPDTVCVQAKLGFYNPNQNLLTRWFAVEYAVWFNLALPALQWANMSLPLGGTSNHFRTAVLRRLGAWDPYNVTEDCDLGVRLTQFRLRTTVLDSMTLEEANSDLKNWIRQRSRWTKGYFQTYLVHMRRPWRFLAPKRWREFISLQLIIGATPATFFVNPLMWTLLGVYIALRPSVAGIYQVLYITPIFYAAIVCLILGNFFYLYIQLVGSAQSGQFGLMWSVPLLPLYWVLMSVAAVMAFFQLIFRPHYWEKTTHGLHLRPPPPAAPRSGRRP